MRLDAVAFMWKRMGTGCQNLPKYMISCRLWCRRPASPPPPSSTRPRRLSAPAIWCPIWARAACREGRETCLPQQPDGAVLVLACIPRHPADEPCDEGAFPGKFPQPSFATYIRCHDDIGWAITPEDTAANPGMDAPAHRNFLADFYNGSFPGSFARGADFPVNPRNRRPADKRQLRLARGAGGCAGPGRRRPAGGRHCPYPDGPRADRVLRRHPPDLYGR